MWSRVHQELRKTEPSLALIRGLTAQALKVTTQAAYDHGSYDMAQTFWPWNDPVQVGERDPVPPPIERQDPFMSMAEAEELSAGMAYLRDVASLAKARGERSKSSKEDHKGGKKGDGKE